MKRMVSLLMVLMILTLAAVCYADVGLSFGLEKAWQESSYDGWDLIDSLEIGNEAFLSIRKNEINRLLHVSHSDKGEWKIDWSNESALPQDSSDPEMPGAGHIVLFSRSNS